MSIESANLKQSNRQALRRNVKSSPNNKRDLSFDAAGRRVVIHFYSDPVDEFGDVLHARLDASGSFARFTVKATRRRDQIVAHHFESLHLGERYQLWSRRFIQQWRLRAQKQPLERLIQNLRQELQLNIKENGRNDPRVALFRAMIRRPKELLR